MLVLRICLSPTLTYHASFWLAIYKHQLLDVLIHIVRRRQNYAGNMISISAELKKKTYWFIDWGVQLQYERPFLSLESGPSFSNTAWWLNGLKSACSVIQLMCSILPSNDIFCRDEVTSLQQRNSIAASNKSALQHWQVHLPRLVKHIHINLADLTPSKRIYQANMIRLLTSRVDI